MIKDSSVYSGGRYKLHLVSHVHWDREWILGFERFRVQLVKLIDTLLKILDTNPEYKSFTLDAEMVNLEDYLDVKPENEEKIRKYIQGGRILIGPWYVAADEFLVGGESLIRNLLWGQRMGERYGGFADVGYLPDQFGHISQMPQVLRGFGINSAIIWRGIGIPWEDSKSEFLWESPDGSEVLVHRLPSKGDYAHQQGYHNAAFLPTDGRKAFGRVKETQEFLSQYATTPNLLLMNGHDFVTPRPDISKTIDKVNKLLKNGKIDGGYQLKLRRQVITLIAEMRLY